MEEAVGMAAEKEAAQEEEQVAASQEEALPREACEARVVVEVSQDRMTAVVRFDTEHGTLHPPKDRVLAALAEAGVAFGIDEAAVARSAESFASFIAAQGERPANGKDARIEKNFDLSVKGHPKLVGHDRVDYKDMNLFVLAHKDDLILVRIPQTEGVPGHDVYGREIPARNGRPVPMPAGKNTEVRNGHELYAAIDGQIVEKGKKIEINPHFVVKDGVGVGTGNIDFTGSVEVQGSVAEGFSVTATGDVHISGNINSGAAKGRNVYVDGGILGKGGSRVVAEEDVRAAFTEHAEVDARRDVHIADAIVHSVIRAGEHVFCEEKRGHIMGGNIVAGLEVRAKRIGTASQVKTLVTVGVDPALEARCRANEKLQKELRADLVKIKQDIETLSRSIATLSEARRARLGELRRAQFPLAGRLKRIALDIEQDKKALAGMKQGRVTGRDRIYPGVSLSICHVKKLVESEIVTSTLTAKEDAIDIQVYQGV